MIATAEKTYTVYFVNDYTTDSPDSYIVHTPNGEVDLRLVSPDDIYFDGDSVSTASELIIEQDGEDFEIDAANTQNAVLQTIYDIVQPT